MNTIKPGHEFHQAQRAMNDTQCTLDTIITEYVDSFYKPPVQLDTVNVDSVSILIIKSNCNLHVIYKGQIIRSYDAVFGPRPWLSKTVEGDRNTPEGIFRIVAKKPASMYNKFLLLDYPTAINIEQFRYLKEVNKIPQDAKIGGSVGIHGIWRGGDDMIQLGIHWTDGCVAIQNKDIDELYRVIKIGTIVEIRK